MDNIEGDFVKAHIFLDIGGYYLVVTDTEAEA